MVASGVPCAATHLEQAYACHTKLSGNRITNGAHVVIGIDSNDKHVASTGSRVNENADLDHHGIGGGAGRCARVGFTAEQSEAHCASNGWWCVVCVWEEGRGASSLLYHVPLLLLSYYYSFVVLVGVGRASGLGGGG